MINHSLKIGVLNIDPTIKIFKLETRIHVAQYLLGKGNEVFLQNLPTSNQLSSEKNQALELMYLQESNFNRSTIKFIN